MNNFYTLPAGTVFKATILNIQPGRVTIRLEEGGSFTARTLVLPDARIGEESYFRVKVNNLDGLIQLEMIKGTPGERQNSIVQEALKNAGMYENAEENMDLGRALIEQNLPIDPQTLQKASFFRYSQPDAPLALDRALFLLQEGFPADAASVQALETALNPDKHLAKVLEKLSNIESISHILGKADKLFVQLDKDPKPLRQFYRELAEVIREVENHPDLISSFPEIKQNLAFMRQVFRQKRYYQIPFMNKGQVGQGELFIYNEGNAVVAVDTHAFGRVEVLVSNEGDRKVSLQFGGEVDNALGLIREKSPQLVKALQQKGFLVEGLDYQKLQERTTVLTSSAAGRSSGPPGSTMQGAKRRYAFDMRV